MSDGVRYFRVRNFERFQHYRDRSPPWIKLYNTVLEDYHYTRLPDAARSHVVAIWLLASRTSNRIPMDASWVQAAIKATGPVDLELLEKQGFIVVEQSASEAPANRSGHRTERESRGEREQTRAARAVFTPPSLEEVRVFVAAEKLNVDPETFVSHFKSNGWKVGGKAPMKDWQAACHTWSSRKGKEQPPAVRPEPRGLI